MAKRYELTDAQWVRIADLLPGKAGDPGRTAADNPLFVNGICGCCAPAVRPGRTNQQGLEVGGRKRGFRRRGCWAMTILGAAGVASPDVLA